MYKAMGLSSFSELVAFNAIEYAEKAVEVITNRQLRAELQSRIEKSCDVLYQDVGFIRSIERLFLQMMEGTARLEN
jgi:predicted O-linked N-acetylglucosamine transferase (SPINDLY family)